MPWPLELGLYVPGVTPLGEEQARELQMRARRSLRSFEVDPFEAIDLALDADVSWRSLPDRDLQLWQEETKGVLAEIAAAESVEALDRIMQVRFEDIVSWIITAEAWEELGADWTLPHYAGVGGALDSGAGAKGDRWQVRAASESGEAAWLSASRRANVAAQGVLDRLVSDPATPLFFPSQHRLKGRLGTVFVGGRELPHLQISFPASYGVSRRSSAQHALWSGELNVMFAPDVTTRVVWVTEVRLVERHRQVNGMYHHRR